MRAVERCVRSLSTLHTLTLHILSGGRRLPGRSPDNASDSSDCSIRRTGRPEGSAVGRGPARRRRQGAAASGGVSAAERRRAVRHGVPGRRAGAARGACALRAREGRSGGPGKAGGSPADEPPVMGRARARHRAQGTGEDPAACSRIRGPDAVFGDRPYGTTTTGRWARRASRPATDPKIRPTMPWVEPTTIASAEYSWPTSSSSWQMSPPRSTRIHGTSAR
jgi:hypothetical protein